MKTHVGITSVSRRYLVGVCAVALLTACAPVPSDPALEPLRDPDAPIASQVDVTADRLKGTWRVIARAGGKAPRDSFRAGAGSDADAKADTVFMFDQGVGQPAQALGQGRFDLSKTEVWVHWMDADDRIAVVGSPRGAFVWVMERKRTPALRAAAQEILDFYGYNRDRVRVPS